MVAVSEAAWVSLLVGVAFNGPRRPPVDLPFLAFALPATAGVALAAGGRGLAERWRWRLPWRHGRPSTSAVAPSRSRRWGTRWAARWPQGLRWPARWRLEALVLLPVAVVGVALTAGLISELSVSGSLWRVATQPWSTVGHRPAVVAGGAWFVALLGWGRGIWLGVLPLSLRHAAWSLALAAAAYVGIFAGRSADHSHAFRAATAGSGWLFFVSFPLAAAAIALVHQRDLERQVLTQASSRPSGAWVAVLALPMVGIAAVALLLAVVVGPVAPILGRAVARAATVVWWGIRDAARWLWDLLPRGHPSGTLPRLPGTGARLAPTLHAPHPGHSTFTVPDVVGEALGGLIVLALVVYLARHVHFPRFGRPAAVATDEERDSVFTWRHLMAQLWAALLGLLHRLVPHRRRPAPPGVGAADAARLEEEIRPRTVRDAYRRLLAAAREAGAPRRPPETTHELEDRFVDRLDLDAADRLRELTSLYESVRYGSGAAGDAGDERAQADVEVVIPALRAALAPPEPAAEPIP
jgi:hypothetical protein